MCGWFYLHYIQVQETRRQEICDNVEIIGRVKSHSLSHHPVVHFHFDLIEFERLINGQFTILSGKSWECTNPGTVQFLHNAPTISHQKIFFLLYFFFFQILCISNLIIWIEIKHFFFVNDLLNGHKWIWKITVSFHCAECCCCCCCCIYRK